MIYQFSNYPLFPGIQDDSFSVDLKTIFTMYLSTDRKSTFFHSNVENIKQPNLLIDYYPYPDDNLLNDIVNRVVERLRLLSKITRSTSMIKFDLLGQFLIFDQQKYAISIHQYNERELRKSITSILIMMTDKQHSSKAIVINIIENTNNQELIEKTHLNFHRSNLPNKKIKKINMINICIDCSYHVPSFLFKNYEFDNELDIKFDSNVRISIGKSFKPSKSNKLSIIGKWHPISFEFSASDFVETEFFDHVRSNEENSGKHRIKCQTF